MTLTYDIYLNSGLANLNHYSEGDNISEISIENSNQDYFQNGFISLFDVPSSQRIGDTVLIKINDVNQFSGYVARKEQEIRAGKLTYTYQLVGKTYDLWRYHTGVSALYTGSTGYIASSLVADYCTGISGGGVWLSGVTITNELDLSNTKVGDAIVRLSEMDGYKFYVDNTNNLQYYAPETGKYDFTIIESDIIDMSPIEEADEDLVNDVLIIGGSDYSTKTEVSLTHPSYSALPSGTLIAQKFLSKGTLLSAVDVYLGRTIDPLEPTAIDFEIWENSENIQIDDDFDNYDYLDLTHSSSMNLYVDNSMLMISAMATPYSFSLPDTRAAIARARKFSQIFKVTATGSTNCNVYKVRVSLDDDYNSDIWCAISPTGGTQFEAGAGNVEYAPSTNNYVVSSMRHGNYGDNTFYFSGATLNSGQYYHTVVWRDDNNYFDIKLYQPGGELGYDEAGWAYDLYNWEYDLWYRLWKNNGAYQLTNFLIDCKNWRTSGCGVTPNIDFDMRSMKISASAILSGGSTDSYLTFSGSIYTEQIPLTNGVWGDFSTTGKSGLCYYYLRNSSNSRLPTRMGRTQIWVRGPDAGVPYSGNKVVHSDDISFTESLVPYPPSWSGWQTYTIPKLRVEDDYYYWMIFSHMSGGTTQDGSYWNLYYDPKSTYDGDIKISTDNGVTWVDTAKPTGNISFRLGWSEGEITATATNQESIDRYGRHFEIINDSTLNTLEGAQARANAEVKGMETIPKKGTITIDGRTDLQSHYRFSSNFDNFQINEIWDVVSFTQRINEQGFTSEINFGKQKFDFMKHISNLEENVL